MTSKRCAASKYPPAKPRPKRPGLSVCQKLLFSYFAQDFQDSRRGGRLCPPDEQPRILAALCRSRCRSQPFATKERYGCGSAACRYTSARWEVTNSPQISIKTAQSAGPMRHPQAGFEAQPRIARLLAPKIGIDPYTETGSAYVCAAAFCKNQLHSAGRTESSAPTKQSDIDHDRTFLTR